MKFSELRSDLQSFSGAKTPEYQLQYMSSELKDIFQNINNQFVEYLTKDISGIDKDNDLKIWLGKYYGASNDNAKDCLEISISVNHIYGRKIKTWTESALKCFDNFLLKHIQDDRKEIIKKNYNVGFERQAYWHLIDLGGDLQEIGQAFDNIYQERNQFVHIQIEERDGVRLQKRFTNAQCNQKRDQIVSWFKNALIILIKE